MKKEKRRTFLKSLAGAGTVAGLPAVAKSTKAAGPSVYEQALRLREKTGSVEKFRNFLVKRGASIATDDRTYEIVKPSSSDDASAQYDKSQLDMQMTMTEYISASSYDLYVDLDFDVTYSLNDGDAPADVVGLGWEAREYDYGDEHYSSDYVSWNKFSTTGAMWNYHDENDDCHCQKSRNVGCRIEPEEGDEFTRHVNASFVHVYSSANIKSITMGTDGTVTVTLEDSTDKWDSPKQSRIQESEKDTHYAGG